MTQRHLIFAIASVILIGILSSCGNGAPKRIVSQTPIKTELFGLKLCSVSNEAALKKAVSQATDKKVDCYSEKDGNHTRFRLVAGWFDEFSYGGVTWHHVDVYVGKDGRIAAIELGTSYGRPVLVQQQYDRLCQLLTKKYGEGNKNNTSERKNMFWTDGTNSVGVSCTGAISADGSNCSFCSMYYVNRELYDKALEEIEDI